MNNCEESYTTIAIFTKSIDLNIAKMKLEYENIDCFVFDENIVSANWLYANAVGGIKLKVKKEDFEHAAKLLGIKKDKLLCPNCESDNIEYKKQSLFTNLLKMFCTMILFLPLFKTRKVCKSCGYEW